MSWLDLVLRDASMVAIHCVVHHSSFAHPRPIEGSLIVLIKLLLLGGHDASPNHSKSTWVFALTSLLLLKLVLILDWATSTDNLCIVKISSSVTLHGSIVWGSVARNVCMVRQSWSKLALVILALTALWFESSLLLEVLALVLGALLIHLLLVLHHPLILMSRAQSWCLMKLSHHF